MEKTKEREMVYFLKYIYKIEAEERVCTVIRLSPCYKFMIDVAPSPPRARCISPGLSFFFSLLSLYMFYICFSLFFPSLFSFHFCMEGENCFCFFSFFSPCILYYIPPVVVCQENTFWLFAGFLRFWCQIRCNQTIDPFFFFFKQRLL